MAHHKGTDVELGGAVSPTVDGKTDNRKSMLKRMGSIFSSWQPGPANGKKDDGRNYTRQIEDSRPGYPRFSALIASHDDFYLCRRFSELRARILLSKQDRLSSLEEQLLRIDSEETDPSRLSSCRADDCSDRSAVLMQIDDALADYDGFVIRNGQMLGFEPARVQAVSSLRNWIAGASCIARSEIAYLDHSHDLFSISSTDDTVICWLEALVEKLLIQLRRHLGLQHYFRRSNNPKVHVVPRASVTRLGRVLMTPFVVGLILAPVIVCNYLASLTARLITVVSAASLFIAVLSGSTKAKTIELVVAGATYTTVLIVFITSNNASAVQQSSH